MALVDLDFQIFRLALCLAFFATAGGIALLAAADLETAGGIARGMAGMGLIAATFWAFRKYWRGDWDRSAE